MKGYGDVLVRCRVIAADFEECELRVEPVSFKKGSFLKPTRSLRPWVPVLSTRTLSEYRTEAVEEVPNAQLEHIRDLVVEGDESIEDAIRRLLYKASKAEDLEKRTNELTRRANTADTELMRIRCELRPKNVESSLEKLRRVIYVGQKLRSMCTLAAVAMEWDELNL